MPTYEFVCKKGHQFVDLLGSYKDPNPPCPKCKSKDVTRQMSATPFTLKGDWPGKSIKKTQLIGRRPT